MNARVGAVVVVRKTEKKRRQGGGEKNKKKQNEIPILLRAVYGRHVYTVRETIRKVCEQFSRSAEKRDENLEDKERFESVRERRFGRVVYSATGEVTTAGDEEFRGGGRGGGGGGFGAARGYPTMSSPPAIGETDGEAWRRCR